MLSQGQFFDPQRYDVHPDKMNFGQFYKTADFYHGSDFSGSTRDWSSDYPQTHAGTEAAAKQRTGELMESHNRRESKIYPLRHTGMYQGETHRDRTPFKSLAHVIPDQNVDWYGDYRDTQLYRNDFEDKGSISAVGHASNFQTYHQYVDSLPNPTPIQQAERRGEQAKPYTYDEHRPEHAIAPHILDYRREKAGQMRLGDPKAGYTPFNPWTAPKGIA